MTKWLLSIVGVAFLSVMLDIIYPNGKTNAFCKSMFAIMAVCVMISPLMTIKNKDISVDLLDENIAATINSSKINGLTLQIENNLRNDGIEGVSVEIDSIVSNNELQIENILIDVSEIVLTENLTNINKYEVISQSVLKIVDIENERIIFYG